MRKEAAHEDTSRVDTAQRVFLRSGNLDLDTPLAWAVYGEDFATVAAKGKTYLVEGDIKTWKARALRRKRRSDQLRSGSSRGTALT